MSLPRPDSLSDALPDPLPEPLPDTLPRSWPEPGTLLGDILTPMPLIDEARMAANIARAQAYMDRQGKGFRPHVKTHKIPALAKEQVAAGAIGINCQKVSEAEAFADAGIDDILITYNILGPQKLARLGALNRRLGALKVVADSAATIQGYAGAFSAERPLTVLIECDCGGGRCGVQTPGQALALALLVAASPGLRFGGLMTYPQPGLAQRVETFLATTMALLAEQGLDCPIRSNGGSPDLFSAHLVPSATEHRAGTYIYYDRMMLRRGACGPEDTALTVLATVVSRPAPDRAILDCGSKTLSSDLAGLPDHGDILELPGARLVGLSEEHGHVDLSGCTVPLPQVGDRVTILPNHACAVTNLFGRMVFHQGGKVTRTEPIAARGSVW